MLSTKYDVSRASLLNFVSLVGTTVYTPTEHYEFGTPNVNVNGLEGDYTSNATYLNVTCRTTDNYNVSAFPNGVLPQSLCTINSTDNSDPSTLSPIDQLRTFDIWTRLPQGHHSDTVAHSSCYLRGVPVQMHVHCSVGKCAATRMRFVPDAAQINRSAFDNSKFTSVFFNNLLLSNGVPNAFTSDNFGSASSLAWELWMAFDGIVGMLEGFPLSSMGLNLSSAKALTDVRLSFFLTSTINTYYQASLDPI